MNSGYPYSMNQFGFVLLVIFSKITKIDGLDNVRIHVHIIIFIYFLPNFVIKDKLVVLGFQLTLKSNIIYIFSRYM